MAFLLGRLTSAQLLGSGLQRTAAGPTAEGPGDPPACGTSTILWAPPQGHWPPLLQLTNFPLQIGQGIMISTLTEDLCWLVFTTLLGDVSQQDLPRPSNGFTPRNTRIRKLGPRRCRPGPCCHDYSDCTGCSPCWAPLVPVPCCQVRGLVHGGQFDMFADPSS